ncbi:protein-L-isoaspartate O-methyltransferase [Candidatus Woesearchaeota archaeon]|nr:protein-L-isoaspartate O-methyltransferase [Candidatus Woesearchaeota archaeon]
MSRIDALISQGVLRTKHIIAAFQHVQRKDFLPASLQAQAGQDHPLPIGYGQTNSQPYTVATMMEWLQPQQYQNILDVGSGSGWTTALLAHIVGPKGTVIGSEIVPELVTIGRKNLAKYDYPWATITQATETGHSEKSPYNRILVSAAADELPTKLLEQLADNGIMVIPIMNSIWVYTKKKDKTIGKEHYGFSFVPLREL